MKRTFLLFLLVSLILCTGKGFAGTYGAIFPNGDTQSNTTAMSLDGYNHQQLNFNNRDQTATLTVMDANGMPQYYYYAEFYTTYYKVYESSDGVNWSLYGDYNR